MVAMSTNDDDNDDADEEDDSLKILDAPAHLFKGAQPVRIIDRQRLDRPLAHGDTEITVGHASVAAPHTPPAMRDRPRVCPHPYLYSYPHPRPRPRP